MDWLILILSDKKKSLLSIRLSKWRKLQEMSILLVLTRTLWIQLRTIFFVQFANCHLGTLSKRNVVTDFVRDASRNISEGASSLFEFLLPDYEICRAVIDIQVVDNHWRLPDWGNRTYSSNQLYIMGQFAGFCLAYIYIKKICLFWQPM